MRSVLRIVWPSLAILLGVAGCESDSALLIVDVAGRPASVQSLRLTAKLNDKQAVPTMQVTSSLDNFGLLLPPEPSGSFLLNADGLDSRSCVVAQGHTDTLLTGHARVRLTLTMTALQLPVCQ